MIDFENEEYSQSFDKMKKTAFMGSEQAQFRMGLIYDNGLDNKTINLSNSKE